MPPYLSGSEQTGDYLSLYTKTYSDVEVNAQCTDWIRCRFWSNKVWQEGYVDMDLPCKYLVFDVC